MFIRAVQKRDRKNNKYYVSHKLVETYRSPRGPRQRVLLNLGSDFPLAKELWKELANRIEQICTGQNHACTTNQKQLQFTPFSSSIDLPMSHLSQFGLGVPHGNRLCSPTSTTAVIRHLLRSNALDPLSFAEKVWDAHFDIYGNWVLNVAQASAELGNAWDCYVSKLSGLNELIVL